LLTSSSDLGDGAVLLVGHETDNGEYDEPDEEARSGVDAANHDRLSMETIKQVNEGTN
jgi:hypothetical protein